MRNLNVKEIKKEIQNNNLKITEYIWNQNLMTERPEDLPEDNDAIKLHLGFLIKTLSSTKWINPKTLYNGRDGIVDLRKTNEGKYKLDPHETVIVYTNESVILKNGISMIISGIYENAGLEVYRSETWIRENEGILQLSIKNNTDEPKLLWEHCEIGNVRFIKEDEENGMLEQRKGEIVNWKIIDENLELPRWEERKRGLGTCVWHGRVTLLKTIVESGRLMKMVPIISAVLPLCVNLIGGFIHQIG